MLSLSPAWFNFVSSVVLGSLSLLFIYYVKKDFKPVDFTYSLGVSVAWVAFIFAVLIFGGLYWLEDGSLLSLNIEIALSASITVCVLTILHIPKGLLAKKVQ